MSTVNYDPDLESEKEGPELSDWKRKCTLYGSLTSMVAVIFIVALHFDSFLLPQLWRITFKNGSMGECTMLAFLTLFAIFIVYVATSTTGLGGYAGLNYNVFFSSWAGLVGCCHTFDLWLVDSVSRRREKARSSDPYKYVKFLSHNLYISPTCRRESNQLETCCTNRISRLPTIGPAPYSSP